MSILYDVKYTGEKLPKTAIPVLVLKILKERSDEKHALNANDIISIIEEEYNLSVDRRTIYTAIKTLKNIGFDITEYSSDDKGCYIRDRQFEPEEVSLLSSAVYTFPFISEKQTKDLLNKIQTDNSIYSRISTDKLQVVTPKNKAINKDFFLNISYISEAIEKKKKISFTYLEYGMDLKLNPKNKKYNINPYAMIYTNGHYYLSGTWPRKTNAVLFRIDMMQDVEIRDSDIDMPLSQTNLKKDLSDLTYASPGDSESFTIRCEKTLLRDIIDQFGTNLIIDYEGNDYFKATVHSTKRGMTFWCLQYMKNVEVINPPEFREEIINILKNNVYLSNGDLK